MTRLATEALMIDIPGRAPVSYAPLTLPTIGEVVIAVGSVTAHNTRERAERRE